MLFDCVDKVLAGEMEAKTAKSIADLCNVALKAAIADSVHQRRTETGQSSKFFLQGRDTEQPKRIAPRFDWHDEGQSESSGHYIGTKIHFSVWRIERGVSFSWRATLEGSTSKLIGSGNDCPNRESAKREAEACAKEFMEKNKTDFETGVE